MFLHPESYPMLLLPRLLDASLAPRRSGAFRQDLVDSTVCGYLYIRIVDGLMDSHRDVTVEHLPALGILHTRFLMPYLAHFAAGHPFWVDFEKAWATAAEATFRDAVLPVIDRAQFEDASARKTCACDIPLAAVCHRYGRTELIDRWRRFTALFGCWHQMANDVLDWHKDAEAGTVTFFLSEAARRQEPDRPLADWAMDEGLTWATELLAGWMAQLQAQVAELESPEVASYLTRRDRTWADRIEDARRGYAELAKLRPLLTGEGGADRQP